MRRNLLALAAILLAVAAFALVNRPASAPPVAPTPGTPAIAGFTASGPAYDQPDFRLYGYSYDAAPRVMLSLAVGQASIIAHDYTQFAVDHTTRVLAGVTIESGYRDDFSTADGVVLTSRYESLAFGFSFEGSYYAGELSITSGSLDAGLLDQALTDLVAAIAE